MERKMCRKYFSHTSDFRAQSDCEVETFFSLTLPFCLLREKRIFPVHISLGNKMFRNAYVLGKKVSKISEGFETQTLSLISDTETLSLSFWECSNQIVMMKVWRKRDHTHRTFPDTWPWWIVVNGTRIFSFHTHSSNPFHLTHKSRTQIHPHLSILKVDQCYLIQFQSQKIRKDLILLQRYWEVMVSWLCDWSFVWIEIAGQLNRNQTNQVMIGRKRIDLVTQRGLVQKNHRREERWRRGEKEVQGNVHRIQDKCIQESWSVSVQLAWLFQHKWIHSYTSLMNMDHG